MGTSNYQYSDRILSQPARVIWEGWESDTLRLQNAGWELSVAFEEERSRYSLAIHNQSMRLYGITHEPIEMRFTRDSAYARPRGQMPTFHIVHMARCIEIHRVEYMNLVEFQPIDARPEYINTPIRSMADYNMFRTIDHAEDVYVEEANMSVLDHLQAIKDLQSPDQEAIRQRLLNARDDAPQIVAHTNIVSLRSGQ